VGVTLLDRVARTLMTVLALLFLPTSVETQLVTANSYGVTYGHIHLNVADATLNTQIWVNHFGGVAAEKGPPAAVWLPGTLMMFAEREVSGGSQGSAIDHVGFKIRDYEMLLSGWRADGYEVQSEFEGTEGERNAYLMTPDGVRVEVQEDPTIESVAEAYHVHFFVTDAEGLRDGYIERYDAQPRVRGAIQVTADVPGMNLSYSQVESERTPTRGRAVDHIGFEVEGLEAFVQKMEAAGVVFDVPYREIASLGLAIAFYTDPAGVYVELTEGLADYR
jgi:catechol 2,3-dioxygenase-like lactoylglutathione lyase family enzyme